MSREVIEIYLPKSTFKNFENAEKVASKWGFNISFRNKPGIETNDEFIFKQKDKSRYGNKERVKFNQNISYLVGIKYRK
tara:strand:- start:1200 stop:1436 length:237 start_codon:yes stop_codon:yes gene_type:complete